MGKYICTSFNKWKELIVLKSVGLVESIPVVHTLGLLTVSIVGLPVGPCLCAVILGLCAAVLGRWSNGLDCMVV